MGSFGITGVDWQQRINWDRLRNYRLNRARERMREHGLGAMLLMYDENIRYVTSTLTPGWNRLKPGLRYALLCEGAEPVLFEQGDIGFQIARHAPWIPQENIRYSYSWIKGAAGPASIQQVEKFTNALVRELKRYDVFDRRNPRETGSLHLGGIVRRAAHPAAGPLKGGPQMVEMSRDGRRVYLTNSLYRTWDAQFFPEGIDGWLVKLDAGEDGSLALDPDFFVEFDGERPHQVRLQGGDASSDSYCFP